MESTPLPQTSIDEGKVRLHVLCDACKHLFGKSKLLEYRGFENREAVMRYPSPDGDTDDKFPKVESWFDHQSLGAVEIAAQRGCHLCTLIKCAMSDTPLPFINRCSEQAKPAIQKDAQNEEEPIQFEVSVKSVTPTTSIDLTPRWKEKRYQTLVLTTINRLSSKLFLDYGTSEYQWKHTSSQAHADLARHWLDRCCREHDKCVTDTNTLPTRLVRLSPSCENYISLCITDEEEEKPTGYTALSHCWGGAEDTLQLTTKSLSQLLEGVPCAELPKNFQDAVTITKWLGLKYIWIDSLCIIQDSKEDWAKEVTTMASVYKNATCTIVTATSPDSHHSCFAERDLLRSLPCKVPVPGGMQWYALLREEWIRLLRPTADACKRELYAMRHSRLQTRGWIYQELVLSPRKLVFTESGIIWTCKTCTSVDTIPGTEGPQEESAVLEKIAKLTLSDKIYQADFNQLWWSVASAYSKRHLTKPEDKLVALSAIAHEVQKMTGFNYVAGLWAEMLPLGLFWEVYKPKVEDRNRPYRAPSWSWASIEGEIRGTTLVVPGLITREMCEHSFAHITFISTENRKEDEHRTGEVFDAHLKLLGILVKPHNYEVELTENNRESYHCEVWIGSTECSVDIDPDYSDVGNHFEELYLLPIFSPKPRYGVYGLLLRCHGDYYTRVGTFHFHYCHVVGCLAQLRPLLCGDKENEEITIR